MEHLERRLKSAMIISTLILVLIPFSVQFGTGTPREGRPMDPVLIVDIPSPEFTVETERIDDVLWSRIIMDRAVPTITDGGPSVPLLSYPLKTRFDIADIEIVRGGPIEVPLAHPLPPSPRIVPLNGGPEEMQPTLVDPDWSEYSKDGVLPEEVLRWSKMGYSWEDGVRYTRTSVSVSPFDHNPAKGKLVFYRDIRLEVHALETDTRSFTRAVDPPASLKEGTELLVITKDSFIDNLQPYTDWKREKGCVVTIVSTTTVDNTYPSMDDPSSMWQYIRDSFFGDGQRLKYVTLAGDHDIVPCRMVKDTRPYGGEPDTLPADTYFSCLDGTYQNWDGDRDGIWAEEQEIGDYYPDVYVSRIPLNSDSDASGWADKIVDYERSPPASNWASTAGLFGATTHYEDDGPRQCEYLWSSYIRNAYSIKDPYYSAGDLQRSVGAKTLTYSNIQQGFNSGLSLVVYQGHGLYYIWSEGTEGNPIYSTSQARSLSQGSGIPFITAMSCETNWFDHRTTESISEEFVENPSGGALAYAGASRTTEGTIGWYEYYPAAPGIQEDIVRMFSQGKRGVAEVFMEAKAHYIEHWGSVLFHPDLHGTAYSAWIEHNVLGPSETQVWTYNPQNMQVSYDYVEDHYTNFTVEVEDLSGDPIGDAKVCIYSPTTKEQIIGYTDTSGQAVLPYRITEMAAGFITVTRNGYRPFQADVVLRDSIGPTTTLEKEITNPNGLGGWYLQDPVLTLSPSEPGETRYQWNGGNTYNYMGHVTVPQGENTLYYWSVDMAGNIEDPKQFYIKYDSGIPDPAITVTPDIPNGNGDWYTITPSVEVLLGETDGSDQKIEYWWDRGDRIEYEGPIEVPDGEAELHILASDEAGNSAEEWTREFLVDTEKPAVDLHTNGAYRNERDWYTSPFEITLTTRDPRAQIYYAWNEEETKRYNDALSPREGNNTLHVYAEDAAGNIGGTVSHIIPYDPNPPVLVQSSTPANPDGDSGWFITSPRVSLSAQDAEGATIIRYRIGPGEWREYINPFEMPEGENLLVAYAEDEAGNRCPELRADIKVDTEVDRTYIHLDGSENGGWYLEVPAITLTTEGGSDIRYSWDGTFFQRYTGSIFPPEDEGSFVLTYYSEDAAGNREMERTLEVNVDAYAPVASVNITVDGKVVIFDMTGSRDGIGVYQYLVDFGDGKESGWVDTPIVEHSYSGSGAYKARITVRDQAGHESETLVKDVSVGALQGDMVLVIALAAVVLVAVLGAVFLLVLYKHRQAQGRPMHMPHPHLPHPHMPHPHLLHSQRGQGQPRKDLGPHPGKPPLPPKGPPSGQQPDLANTSTPAPTPSMKGPAGGAQGPRPIPGGTYTAPAKGAYGGGRQGERSLRQAPLKNEVPGSIPRYVPPPPKPPRMPDL